MKNCKSIIHNETLQRSDYRPSPGNESPAVTTVEHQAIIYGGGWKTPPREYSLKIKAICGGILTVATLSAGTYYYDAFGVLGFAPAVALLIATLFMARFERPILVPGLQDGDHDIRNLYGQKGLSPGKRESGPSKTTGSDDVV